MIHVLLIIEVPFYREGLETLLNQCADVTVVGAVADADSAIRIGVTSPVDVVLLDIGSQDSRLILRRWLMLPNACPVVALAIGESPDAVVEWAQAGIKGYLSRTAGLGDLLECLRCAIRGEAYCTPRIMSILLHRLAVVSTGQAPAAESDCALTTREREILELVGKGLSNKVIASKLNISHATAKNHVHHILEKLNLRSRSQAASYLHSHEKAGGAAAR
jgi:DNA-binding NarL/FixJ family response regulator